MIIHKIFLTEHLKKEKYYGKEKLMAVKDIKEYEIIKDEDGFLVSRKLEY